MSDESDQEPLAASAIGDGDHASLALAYGVCALPVANISLPLASGSRVPRQVSLPVLLEFVHIFNQPVCASYRNMICCGIASRVLVYASHNGSFVHSSTVEIANNVTACSFSARGGYLVIGDDKCLAHFVQVGLWECVASIAVSKDESSQINLITHHIRDPEHEDIIFVLTNLRMLRFTNVDFRKLESDAGRTDFCSLSPGSAEGICVRSIDLKAHGQGLIRDIASVLPWRGTFIETFESFLTAGSGKSAIHLWQRKKSESDFSIVQSISTGLNANVTLARCDAKEKYAAILESDGQLSVWDFKRMILLKKFSTKAISDFCFVEQEHDLAKLQILTLLAAENGKRYAELVSLPSYATSYRFQVAEESWLIQSNSRMKFSSTAIEMFQTDAYIVELVSENDVMNPAARIRAITRMDHQQYLKNLVKSGQFEVAVTYAKSHNIDFQDVLKSKLLNYISQPVCNISLKEVIDNLDHLEDNLFRLEILSYARHHCGRNLSTNSADIHQLIHRLCTFRLLMTSAISSPGDTEIEFDWKHWQTFRSIDLVEELRERSVQGDLNKIMLIWNRHCDLSLLNGLPGILGELSERVPAHAVIRWLKCDVIPKLLSAEQWAQLANWAVRYARIIETAHSKPHIAQSLLLLLSPSLDLAVPETMNSGIKTSLETTATTPASYISKILFGAQKSDMVRVGFNDWEGKNEVLTLLAQLDDLTVLWDSHGIKMSLNEYCQTSPKFIALDLLDLNQSFELFADTVECHFLPYCKRHSLNSDLLLLEYGVEIMNNSADSKHLFPGGTYGCRLQFLISPHSEGMWETRVLEIMNYVSDKSVRSDMLLELLYRSPIPWSQYVENEIVKTLAVKDSPKIAEITEQYRLMRLKRVLHEHRIVNFNISDFSKSKALLRFILSNIASSVAMKQALQVVAVHPRMSKTEAYVIRMRFLFRGKETKRAISLLLTGYEHSTGELPEESALQSKFDRELDGNIQLCASEKMSVAEEIFCWLYEIIDISAGNDCNSGGYVRVILTFREDPDFDWSVDASIALCLALKSVMEEVQSTMSSESDKESSIWPMQPVSILADYGSVGFSLDATIKNLQNIKQLSEEFNVRMSLKTYKNDDNARRDSLNTFAKEVFKHGFMASSEHEESPTIEKRRFSKTELYRFAELLGFKPESIDGIIAEESARNGDIRTSLILCKELHEKTCDQSAAYVLRNVAVQLAARVPESCNSNNGEMASTHRYLTRSILDMSRKSVIISDVDSLGDCLDDFKNFEILHEIFNNCDAGYYSTVVAYPAESRIEFSEDLSSSSSMMGNILPHLQQDSAEVDLTQLKDTFASCIFKDRFYEKGLILPTGQTMTLASGHVLDLASEISQDTVVENRGKNKCASSGSIESGQSLAILLRNNRVFSTAFRLWQRIWELKLRGTSLPRHNVTDSDVEMHFSMTKELAETILCSRETDPNLAFGFLLALDMSTAFQVFKTGMSTTGTDYNRLLTFAAIGAGCGLAWNQIGFRADCIQLAKNSKWWHQLALLGIPVETESFRASRMGEYQRALVPDLLKKTGFDIATALEFTRAYNIEDDCAVLEYISLVLQSDILDEDKKCRIAGISDDVTNKEALLRILMDAFKNSSSTNYEKIEFIFSQILRFDSQNDLANRGLQVVNILRVFTRQSQSDSMTNTPPCRLPFHTVINKKWEYLAAEVNEKSVTRLIALSAPLEISRDDFYLEVIGKLRSQAATGMIKFSDVRTFLDRLSSSSTAADVASRMADEFPPGTEKIATATYALSAMEKSLEALGSEDQLEQARRKVESLKYRVKITETEHDLTSANLNEFLDLADRPQKLIEELYRCYSEKGLSGHLDLHGIVDRISSRFGIDVLQFRSMLLQRQLLIQDLEVSADEKSLYLPSMRLQTRMLRSSDEKKLQLQLLYIARSVTVQEGIQFFLAFAYTEKSKVQTFHRIRSLCVLFLLADPQDIEDSGNDFEAIRSYMQILLYMLDFEELRIVQSVKKFHECDKESLVKSLWLNYGTEVKTAQLICNLCLDYNLFDITLWDNALNRLVKLQSTCYLAGIIEQISNVSELSSIPSLPKVWNQTIKLCLKNSLDNSDPALYLRAVELIQKCPFSDELDTEDLAGLISQLSTDSDGANSSLIWKLKGLSALLPNPFVSKHIDVKSAFAVISLNRLSKTGTHRFVQHTRSPDCIGLFRGCSL
ncbi:Kinetochore-associated protein 1 [Entophlyctis luteolus]|nr:Kinetochore-associated protein 1 [Entophlyctis luteolus]